MKAALKSKDTFRLSVIRMLISDVQGEAFSTQPKKRTAEAVVMAYYKKLVKAKAGFADKVDFVAKSNLVEVNMRSVMPLVKGKADGKLVQEIIANWVINGLG